MGCCDRLRPGLRFRDSLNRKHECSRRGVAHNCQTTSGVAETARIRIVPTGIEDDNVQSVVGIGHFIEDLPRIQSLIPDIRLPVDSCPNGNKIVRIADLQTMTGILLSGGTHQSDEPIFQILPAIL